MTPEGMDRVLRRANPCAPLPWQAPAPDEELMAAEEMEAEGDDGYFRRLAAVQELIFSFAFAGGDARCWQAVALRLVAVMRRLAPSVLVGRGMEEVEELVKVAGVPAGWPLEDLVAEVASWDVGDGVVALMGWWFPAVSREWVKHGTRRVYLLAKAYQPTPPGAERMKRGGKEAVARDFSYAELAEIFGEDPVDNPRARWSARAKALMVQPIEKAGGHAALRFGKGAETRAKYRTAAWGNSNRRKKG